MTKYELENALEQEQKINENLQTQLKTAQETIHQLREEISCAYDKGYNKGIEKFIKMIEIDKYKYNDHYGQEQCVVNIDDVICNYNYLIDNLAEGFTEADRIIRAMPTADVVEVRHGKWIDLHDEDVLYEQTYKCSVCGECFVLETGTPQENEYNYCPHCGAKMNRKEEK